MAGNTNFVTNEFLLEPEKEVYSYKSISEKNLSALHKAQNDILSFIPRSLNSATSDDKLLQVKKENALQKRADAEKKAQITAMSVKIKKKEIVVASLEKKLKELTVEYERLKTEQKKKDLQDRKLTKIFVEALKYYTKYFGYLIEAESLDDDKFCAVITFVLEGKLSKYPIRFVFDKECNSLISFNAGELLNEKQHEILHQHLKESTNYSNLFCVLRHAAIRKHKS